jgi:predicted nucleic acid-binding protein
MNKQRWFIDTAFVQALFNRSDQYHEQAVGWLSLARGASELWTTGAVLLEIGNVLAASNRKGASEFIRQSWQSPNFHVVSADDSILRRALQLFDDRPDKTWSLTDCMSFIVMADQGLTEALTTDHHFEQAGFIALLLRKPGE